MEGIAEAMKFVQDLADAARSTEVLNVSGERDGVYFLVGSDGTTTKHVAEPGWHKEFLDNPGEFKAFVEKVEDAKSVPPKPEGAEAVRYPSGIIFYDESGLIYARDADDRRDTAHCRLTISPQYAWLKMFGGKDMPQREFVRALRISLNGCLPSDGGFLALVRELVFTGNAEGVGSIQHGRESMGKKITENVTGQSSIPEQITVRVPIFENFGQLYAVQCAVEVFPSSQSFALTPFPGQMLAAMDGVLAELADLLKDDGMPPAYRGRLQAK